MLNLEMKNQLDPLKSNSLDAHNCLFTPELLNLLLLANKDCSTYFNRSSQNKRKISKDKHGVYLIAFSVLNKEEKSLVYNYTYYNDHLYLTLIVYFLTRNYFIYKDNHEWGNYLVVIDNNYLDYDRVDKYINPYTKYKTWNKP